MADPDDDLKISKPALSYKKPAVAIGCGGCVVTPLALVFFLAFGSAGSLVLWFATLGPLVDILRAQGWESIPCVIQTSEVKGDDTYKVSITYQYEVNGQQHTGDRYSFADLSTSGKAGKKKIVDQFPPGLKTNCFVNPGNVQESVLYRGLRSSMWWGLFSVPFLAVGFGGGLSMIWGRKKLANLKSQPELSTLVESVSDTGRKRTVPRVNVEDSEYDEDSLREEPGPITLTPDSTPMGAFIGLLIFTVICDGILSIFLVERVGDWLKLDFDWIPDVFLIPFTFGGVMLIVATFRAFLATYNPVPVVTLSRQLLPLGGKAGISWEFQGSTRSVKFLKLMLKGIEEARYTRGTSTYTDTQTFLETPLYETGEPAEIAAGKALVNIPTDTMHSFNGKNNKIKWQLQLRGEIAGWPDIHADFPLRVVPHE